MMDQTRMPIVPASQRNKSAPFVGETEFIDPDNEIEHVKIYIHMAQVEFLDEKLEVSKNKCKSDRDLELGSSVSSMMNHFSINHLSGQKPLC